MHLFVLAVIDLFGWIKTGIVVIKRIVLEDYWGKKQSKTYIHSVYWQGFAFIAHITLQLALGITVLTEVHFHLLV